MREPRGTKHGIWNTEDQAGLQPSFKTVYFHSPYSSAIQGLYEEGALSTFLDTGHLCPISVPTELTSGFHHADMLSVVTWFPNPNLFQNISA